MQNIRSSSSLSSVIRVLWTSNNVDKNKSRHLAKKACFIKDLKDPFFGSVLNNLNTTILKFRFPPRHRLSHRVANNSTKITNLSTQTTQLLYEERLTKCKVVNDWNVEMPHLVMKKQKIQNLIIEVKLLDKFESVYSRSQKQQNTDNLVNESEMKTDYGQFSKDILSVISSSETSDICHNHYYVSPLPFGMKNYSVNMKHLSKNKFKNVRFRPAVTKQYPLPYATPKVTFLLPFITGQSSFWFKAHAFSSSTSSLTPQSVIENSDLTLKKALNDINSVKCTGLHMSGGSYKLNDEQNTGTGHSESWEIFSAESVGINKDLRERVKTSKNSGVNSHFNLEFTDVSNDSKDIYDDLYFNLMNEGNLALTNSCSDLSSHEITKSCDNYAEKYTKLMRADEEVDVASKGKLTHTDSDGNAVMVDVGEKIPTVREAQAEARIYLGLEAAILVKENKMKKGDVLTVAQIAGIMSAKQTAQLIPLCHNINLTKVDVVCVLNDKTHSVDISSYVRTIGVTGVEMEALTAASIAALTVYDMCKAVTHDMIISDVRLVSKSGGKRNFQR